MIRAIRAELFKFYFDIKRYLFNYSMGIIITSIFLGGIYWGTRALFSTAGQATAFMGLLLWLFASSALSGASDNLAEERYLGTLERISVVKTQILHILTARFFVTFIFTLCRLAVIGGILYITFRPPIEYSLSSFRISVLILITSAFTIVSLYGFGLFIASLGLVVKRVGAMTSILEYLILFFSGIVIPWDRMPPFLQLFSKVLPMTWGIRAFSSLQTNGRFWLHFGILILYTGAIILLGVFTFHLSMHFVKKKGTYSSY